VVITHLLLVVLFVFLWDNPTYSKGTLTLHGWTVCMD